MRPRLAAIFLLIVLLPLGLLMWLGLRVAHYEQQSVRSRFDALLASQLSDVDQVIARFMAERGRELLTLTEVSSPGPAVLRELAWQNPFVRQVFYLDADGTILHPSPESQLSAAERQFLERTKEILINKNLLRHSPEERVGSPASQPAARTGRWRKEATTVRELYSTKTHGWYVSQWGRHIQILFWRQQRSGRVIGAELDSIRIMSEVIGLLPGTEPTEAASLRGRIVLVGAAGQPAYQWGTYQPAEDQLPLVARQVSYPLNSWKLEYYLRPEDWAGVTGRGMYFVLIAGVATVGLTLVGLAVYFYRENTREMREAQRRVSFVNQVSHELRTPLTNIRMYAELLENDLSDDEEKGRQHLGVIVSESQRLSRLIGNILSFSRRQRNALRLRLGAGVVDELVESVLANFRAAFEACGIRVAFDGQADRPVRLDRDAIEQILGNLFNNVEKYAASSGLLEVRTRHDGGQTVITVSDRGPGIPPRQRERVFWPFYRISDRVADGVAGTGIGLSIARDLARLHGGDLVALPTTSGAAFELRIATLPVAKPETP